MEDKLENGGAIWGTFFLMALGVIGLLVPVFK